MSVKKIIIAIVIVAVLIGLIAWYLSVNKEIGRAHV